METLSFDGQYVVNMKVCVYLYFLNLYSKNLTLLWGDVWREEPEKGKKHKDTISPSTFGKRIEDQEPFCITKGKRK